MVKNLKINNKGINTNKKFKLSKIGLGVVSIISSITLFLTGCGVSNSNKNNGDYYYISSNDINYFDENYDALNDPFVTIDSNDYSNSDIVVSTDAYNRFIHYINNKKVVYNYEQYYNIDTAYSKYKEVVNKKTTKHSHSLESFTVDALVRSVKNNNKIFLEQKKSEYTAEFYEEFSESDLRKYCSIIIEMVSYYEKNGLIEDINEVKCVLGSLKIFSRPTMTNAYITDDNCLMISPSMIKTLEIKVIATDQDVEKSTIGHEAIHLLQKSCEDNNKIVYSIGNSYKFDNMSVNPLFYNWFYEGSAEKLMINATNYKPLVYEYYINYINSLSLSTVLNKNNYVNQPEQAALSNSLEPLFGMFGCQNEEDRKETIKLMYSLDIIETDTEDFINAVNPNMTNEELVKIKRDLKGSICETLSKYFYRNLARLVKDNKVPLNDVFYYITLFEADVDSHITYADEEKYNDSIAFIQNYLDIQQNFFNFLSSSNKYSQEEIENMFDTYGLKKQDGTNNFDLSYLSAEKKAFLNTMLNKLYDNSFEQIKDIYEKNDGSNVKK